MESTQNHHDAKKNTIQDHETTRPQSTKSIPLKGEQEFMA
jgi:hypothetical protein